MKNIRYIWIICIAFVTMCFTSCSEDDGDAYPSGNGPVTVSKIFLEDAESTVPDREVTFARLGQTLRIGGSGFGGTKILIDPEKDVVLVCFTVENVLFSDKEFFGINGRIVNTFYSAFDD